MTRELKLAWTAWITVCVVWGTTYLAISVALETVPVLLVAGLRWMLAGLLLTAVVYATGRRLPGRQYWAELALLGFLMNVIGNGVVVWAQQYVPSGLTAVVVAMVPFWLVCVEAMLPRGERFTWPVLAGLALGFAGIVVLLWPSISLGDSTARGMIAGVLALQLACAGWALGTSYSKRTQSKADPLAGVAMQMIFSGTMLLGLATMAGEWSALHFSARSLSALVYLIVGGSAIAYTAYIYALGHLPISTVSLYAYINPIIAVALGSLVLDEPFSLRIFVASALVFAGIVVVRGVQSRHVPAPEPRRAHA